MSRYVDLEAACRAICGRCQEAAGPPAKDGFTMLPAEQRRGSWYHGVEGVYGIYACDAFALRNLPSVDVDALRERKDGAYRERNQVVAALAACALMLGWRAGRALTAIDGWSEDWHGCVYIDLPTGQVSWHFHDSQAEMFAWLPPYSGAWDGHDTPEKYERVARLREQEPAQDCPHEFAEPHSIGVCVLCGKRQEPAPKCDGPALYTTCDGRSVCTYHANEWDHASTRHDSWAIVKPDPERKCDGDPAPKCGTCGGSGVDPIPVEMEGALEEDCPDCGGAS